MNKPQTSSNHIKKKSAPADKNNNLKSPEKKKENVRDFEQKNEKNHNALKEKPAKKASTEKKSIHKFSSLLMKKKQNEMEKSLRKEIEDLQKSYRYLQAEFANYKRNSMKERQDTMKYAVSNAVKDLLLNVLNDFNRAMDSSYEEKDFESFKKGMEIIHSQFIKYLKSQGVEEINPQGEVFDPHFHEVLGVQEKLDIPPHTILTVCRKGYKIHDRLIQPAQVIINKEHSQTAANSQKPADDKKDE